MEAVRVEEARQVDEKTENKPKEVTVPHAIGLSRGELRPNHRISWCVSMFRPVFQKKEKIEQSEATSVGYSFPDLTTDRGKLV